MFLLRLTVKSLLWCLVIATLAFWVAVAYPIERYAVKTGSMAPTIPIAAVVYLDNSRSVAVNDVITFRMNDGSLITHRLIGFKPNGELITKGDAVESQDNWAEPITTENVVGRVQFSVPYLGYALAAIDHMPAKTWAIGTSVFILYLAMSFRVRRQKQPYREAAEPRGQPDWPRQPANEQIGSLFDDRTSWLTGRYGELRCRSHRAVGRHRISLACAPG